MSYNKIDIFYPFDKGFFGKTLISAENKVKTVKSSKSKMDSVDDFIKYFSDKCKHSLLERSPKADNYEIGKNIS